MIHSTAIIHPKAKLDSSVEVGPYAVIDEGVSFGAACVVGPHVYITGQTVIGARNRFYAGCVIGEAPQDMKYSGAPTGVQMGDGNVFRENVTVHRGSAPGSETVMGSENFLMAGSHVGHNCRVGNQVILANGALLGGHATVDDRAFISGHSGVHQFVRVGELALMQGLSGASRDVPPYMVVYNINLLCGLNVLGLRRAGVTAAERLELKQVYHALFRRGVNLPTAIAAAREKFLSAPARKVLDFVSASKRGICFDGGKRPNAQREEEE